MKESKYGRPRLMDDPQFKRRFNGVLPRILDGNMSYAQAAEICGCSKKSIIRHVRISQGLPPERIHRSQTMPVQEYMNEQIAKERDELNELMAKAKADDERHYNTMKELYAKQEQLDKQINGRRFWKEVLKEEDDSVQELIGEWLDS